MATNSKSFPLRFRDDQLRERLQARAAAEHRSMNDLANDAIAAWLDGRIRPIETVDKSTLRQLMREIADEDREIFAALKRA